MAKVYGAEGQLGILPSQGEGVKDTAAVKVNCDCGFIVGSHDETEVSEITITHVKNKHGQTISMADARKLMKPM